MNLRTSTAPRAIPGCLAALAVVAAVSVSLAADRTPAAKDSLLEQRLAAGEFGPALDAARAVNDVSERVLQLRKITTAQRQSGDFRAAEETARSIPESADRGRAGAEIARASSLAGGGTANFQQLMTLIQTTVEPESWQQLGGTGNMSPYNTGVYVDPNGLMRTLTKVEQTGALEQIARRSRPANLNEDLARPAKLRFVSLPRLERAVAERLKDGQPVLETMRRLAGLTRIQYVVTDPQSHELLLGGPAEGWSYDENGRPVGRESGQPLLDLDDLVVVLRSFAPGNDQVFGCSINTRDANLKNVKEFVEASNRAGPLGPGQLSKWLKELHGRLGLQDVVVHGVPADTRVAQVLVEADYKMKLIGVDKLDGGPDIPSYFDLLRRSKQTAGAPMEALRWWLTMKYDAILHSPDRAAFEISGQSVLLQSENQFVTAQGKHMPTGIAEPVNRAFAENFTKNYAALCEREPVFTDLRNIFDMALAAALLRQEGLHERAGWDLGAFASAGEYHPAQVYAPKVVDSVINHKVYGGKDIVVQVAGGVQADVLAIARDKQLARESSDLGSIGSRKAPVAIPEGRWWWDAGE